MLWLSVASANAATSHPPENAANDNEGLVDAQVITRATPRFVEALLDKLEFPYKPAGKNSYLLQLDGVKMLVLIENSGGLMLYCGFHGLKVSAGRINDWNKKHRFSRAYLDDANDPVLESDLDFDGGVTLESLRIFLTVFRSSATEYQKFLAP